TLGTDPNDTDTDGDGLQDGTEVGTTEPEANSDGVADTDMSICIPDNDPSTRTNALLADSDGDGCPDGAEDSSGDGNVDAGESDPNLPGCLTVQGGGVPFLFRCSLTQDSNPSPGNAMAATILALLLGILLCVWKKIKLARSMTLMAILLFLNAPAAFSLDVQSLNPGTGAVKGYHLLTSDMLPKQTFAAGLSFNWDHEPLEFGTGADPSRRQQGIVDDFATVNFLFSYAFLDGLAVDLDFPFNLYHDLAPILIPNRDEGGADPGDLLLRGRIQLFDAANTSSHLGLAVAPFVTFPSGDETIHFGDANFTGGVLVAGDWLFKGNRLFANIGTRLREREQIVDLIVDHEFLFGLGYQRPLSRKHEWDIIFETYGSTTYRSFFKGNENSSPVESHLLIQKKWDHLILNFGPAMGWSRGYSTSDWRGIAGVTYAFGEKSRRHFVRLNEKIHFYTNQAVIHPRSFQTLEEVAVILKNHPEIRKIVIEGHTDSRAPDDFNMKLSERRARAGYDYLVKKGVESKRLHWVGYGETRPIAENDTEDNRAKNRRTVIRILEVDYDALPKNKPRFERDQIYYEEGDTLFDEAEPIYPDS
ncbi:MAG: OmpA family protein, partial [Deltaproteobacteria bacterium]|nr:OmpA family protein [Deltaproteobacteria bacterium]